MDVVKLKSIFWEIYDECNNEFEIGCGSYLFDGQIYKYDDRMYEKQILLFNQSKTSNKVLEIGTYMGHSLLIMLLANPELDITCIDISDKFTKPAIEVLRRHFPKSNINFILGDSADVLPKMNNDIFDLFHIDGTHNDEYATMEFNNCRRMYDSNLPFRVFLDDVDDCQQLVQYIDTNFDVVKKHVPNCIYKNMYLELKNK